MTFRTSTGFIIGLRARILVALNWETVKSLIGSKEPSHLATEVTPSLPEPMEANEQGPLDLPKDRRQEIAELFAKDQFLKALTLIKSELALASITEDYRNWLERQKPTLFTSLAWEQINQKNCDEALPLLEKSLSLRNEVFAMKGMGYCLYNKRMYWQAEPYLRRYIQQAGPDYDASLILADSLESLSQFEDAALILSQALEKATLTDEQRKSLQNRSTKMKAKLEESNYQTIVETDLITLSYRPLDHEDIAGWVITTLEETMEELEIDLGLPRPNNPLEVILYPKQTFSQVSHGPAWATGLFDGRLRIPVVNRRDSSYLFELARTLRHEFVHGVLTEAIGGRKIPTWFHEGLAGLMECPGMCDLQPLPLNRDQFLPMDLLEGSFLGLRSTEVQLAYSQSFYLVRTILKLEGQSGLRLIIENMQQNSTANSQQLLAPLTNPPNRLLQFAKKNWRAGLRL